MLIREATMDDFHGLCVLFEEVDALHAGALPHVFCDPGDPARPWAYIASIVQDESACLWVAEHEGQIVGLLKIAIQKTRDIPVLVPRCYAEINTLAVAKQYQRRGIGRALMEAAERWASERDVDQIELSVWEFNEQARGFYSALGYSTARRRLWKSGAGIEEPNARDSP